MQVIGVLRYFTPDYVQRAELNQKISTLISYSSNSLIWKPPLSLPTNTLIFEAVHKYISDTKRF